MDERYCGSCAECDYWPIFAKEDGAIGYNDWEIVEVVPAAKGYVEEDVLDCREETMDMLGWRISKGITDRGFGVYVVDDDRYDYYVVQWDGTPKQATKTETIRIEEEDFPVRKGEWICYGRWLNPLGEGTNRWWYQTEQKCVVRLQVVCDPSLDLVPYDKQTNQLSGADLIRFAERNETYRVPDDAHTFLLDEASSRAVFDFSYKIENEGDDGEDSDEEEGHEDDEGSVGSE